MCTMMKCLRQTAYRVILFLGLPALLMMSCKKGDTGPAGTANVMFSDWFKPETYKKDTVFGIWGFNYTQDAPGITQNVLDSGTVIVYGKLLGYNSLIWPTHQISALPVSLTYVSGSTMTDTWSSLASVGKVKIRFVNDKNFWTAISNAHMFRYIIIPGARKAPITNGRGIMTRNGKTLDMAMVQDITENYSLMSYEDICAKLDIPQ